MNKEEVQEIFDKQCINERSNKMNSMIRNMVNILEEKYINFNDTEKELFDYFHKLSLKGRNSHESCTLFGLIDFYNEIRDVSFYHVGEVDDYHYPIELLDFIMDIDYLFNDDEFLNFICIEQECNPVDNMFYTMNYYFFSNKGNFYDENNNITEEFKKKFPLFTNSKFKYKKICLNFKIFMNILNDVLNGKEDFYEYFNKGN